MLGSEPPVTETLSRRERKARQKARLTKKNTLLLDAIRLIDKMTAPGNKNDPAATLRNIRSVIETTLVVMKEG